VRGRGALWGYLASEAVSLTGTRVSMIAIPWLVLTTTGSAVQTGLVAFAEMAPYVVLKALAGPWTDRLGARRICIAADLASVLLVGVVPLLHLLDMLTLPVLLVLVGAAGAVRGPGDGARQALVPAVVDRAGVTLERATGLSGAVERLASTLGAAFAGLLVAAVGPAPALVVDAASFAVSAVLLALTAPAARPREPESDRSAAPAYRRELREGWDFLRRDPVLVAMTAMVSVTNLLDAAFIAVLLPVWARETGGGAGAVGLFLGTFSAAAVLGSVVASAAGDRIPRYLTYVVCFSLVGLPRFLVLGLEVPLGWVLPVCVGMGFACGFINPILGAVIYERIPAHLVGRVTSLNSALCWSLLPLGGLLGGALVAAAGMQSAMLLVGVLYTVTALSPVLVPAWRTIDRRPSADAREPVAVS
jgi:MFS family permease